MRSLHDFCFPLVNHQADFSAMRGDLFKDLQKLVFSSRKKNPIIHMPQIMFYAKHIFE